MSDMYPFISPIEHDFKDINEPLPTFYEVAWDFDKEIPIIENGDFKIVKENEALKVWIWHALNINRFEHSIYSWNFGSEVKSLIGKGYSVELTKADFERYVKEALGIIRDNEQSILNPYILDVKVDNVTFDRDTLSGEVTVNTIYEGGVVLNV